MAGGRAEFIEEFSIFLYLSEAGEGEDRDLYFIIRYNKIRAGRTVLPLVKETAHMEGERARTPLRVLVAAYGDRNAAFLAVEDNSVVTVPRLTSL